LKTHGVAEGVYTHYRRDFWKALKMRGMQRKSAHTIENAGT